MTNSTFIIPCKIDSSVRYDNILLVVDYLQKHTTSNIVVYESDKKQNLSFTNNKKLKYIFERSESDYFHRTKILNKMLNEVETQITINYDCDVLLNPETYIKAENKILNENFDLVYPYGFEQNDQRLIPNTEEHRYNLKKNLNITDTSLYKTALCRYGHVQFFKTKSYRQGFMENENYRHWGPEDVERCIRFQKLEYNVCWMPGTLVFHLEHPLSVKQPHVDKQEILKLHDFLMSLSKEKLYEYYKNQSYLKDYKNE